MLDGGGGGLDIAIDLTKTEIFKSYNIIAYDSDSSYFEEILKQEKNLPLYFSTIPENKGLQTSICDFNYYSEDLLNWETTVGGISKINDFVYYTWRKCWYECGPIGRPCGISSRKICYFCIFFAAKI